MRICSFVPGATEIVAELGLADALVGRSHECDHPPQMASIPALTSAVLPTTTATSGEIDRQVRARLASAEPLYRIDERGLREAAPDLIITQGLCRVCGITPEMVQPILSGMERLPRILSLNPSRLEDVLTDVLRVGEATGTAARAAALIDAWRSRLDATNERTRSQPAAPRVVCLEWFDPLYVAGHWIPRMVELAGGRDVLGTHGAPSRRVTWDEINAARPDVLVVMPCGFSLARAVEEWSRQAPARPWHRLPAVETGQVFAIDANAYTSRPGPRLVRGVELLSLIVADPGPGTPLPEGLSRLDRLAADALA